jgi:hypothetical protein
VIVNVPVVAPVLAPVVVVKKSLAEVMAEERIKAQEEGIVREMREAEEEAARKTKQVKKIVLTVV